MNNGKARVLLTGDFLMEIKIETYTPGQNEPLSAKLLADNIKDLDIGVPYAEMLRNRVAGGAKEVCTDNYYIALANDDFAARLWTGWGNHKNAVANFGHFNTLETLRGKGIGRRVMDFWKSDIDSLSNPPLAIFCTAAKMHHDNLYSPYGFRWANGECAVGPLYMPLGNSPETFSEFCEVYYSDTENITMRPATVDWRHEIDCLLKFALLLYGEKLALGEITTLEERLVKDNAKDMYLLFSDDEKVVGWAHKNGEKFDVQLYPKYRNIKIKEEF